MAFAQSPNSTSQLYTDQKKYEAFIFSVPVLFCIILFILFYLFYLQTRASVFSHPPPLPPTFIESPSFSILVREAAVLKEDLRDKLPTIVFDEELKSRDSLCCVCLGEFEMQEELIQVPSCKHIFHSDCIGNWLSSSATCPLCRCSVVVADDTKLVLPPPQRSPAVRLPTATSTQLAVI